MGINDKSRELSKLKVICNNPEASPERRLRAAGEGLIRFGCTQRWTPIVKRLVKMFEHYQDPSLAKQKLIREMAAQLEQNLKAAIRTAAAQKQIAEETDEADEAPEPASQDTPTGATPIDFPEIGGLDLLPNPSDEASWRRFVLSVGRNPRLMKSELLSSIDIPLWIGERETTGRTPVNLARPSELQYHLADSELDWSYTVDLAVEATPAARAAYRAESAALIHARLTEFGVTPEGYISIPDLLATLDVAYASLRPPYVTFERVSSSSSGWYDSDFDSQPVVKLTLTDSGEKKRFINLLRARLSHGFDIYGRKSLGPVVNNLAVAQGDSICSPQIR